MLGTIESLGASPAKVLVQLLIVPDVKEVELKPPIGLLFLKPQFFLLNLNSFVKLLILLLFLVSDVLNLPDVVSYVFLLVSVCLEGCHNCIITRCIFSHTYLVVDPLVAGR